MSGETDNHNQAAIFEKPVTLLDARRRVCDHMKNIGDDYRVESVAVESRLRAILSFEPDAALLFEFRCCDLELAL
jgi:hypothetical protein